MNPFVISYQAKSLAEFKEAVEWLNKEGLLGAKTEVSPPELGPWQIKYLEFSGEKRFRLTKEEKQQMARESLNREDIAKLRLDSLGYVDTIDNTEEKDPFVD